MKPRTTLIMLVVFLAIGSYVYFYEMKGGEKRASEKEASEKLVDINKDSVSALYLSSSGISLKKSSGKWTIVEPVQAMTDEYAVTSIITSVESAKREREFTESPAAYERYGLDQRAAAIVLTSPGRQDTVYVGDKNLTGASAYVRVNHDSSIYLTAAGIAASMQKTLYDLRDKSVVVFEANDATSMKLKTPKAAYEMRKEEGKWRLKQPVQALADESKVTQLLNRVRNGRIKRFIEEETADLKKYGLDRPLYEMEIRYGGDNAIKTVRVGKADKEIYYSQDSSRPPVFAIDSTLVRDLNVKLTDLLERRLNDFQSHEADEFTLEYPGESFTCLKDTSGAWRFAAADSAKVKSWKASDLLGSASGLRAEPGATSAGGNAGLNQPRAKITIKSKGKEVASLTIGKEQGDLVYAKGSLQPDWVMVKRTDADKLFVSKGDLAEEAVKP
jgi:hypothetical protein